MSDFRLGALINAFLFAGLGILLFLAGFAIATRPFDLRRQVLEERNVPAAILGAGIALALAWVVASAVH